MTEIILFVIVVVLLGMIVVMATTVSHWYKKYMDLKDSINQIVIKELGRRAKQKEFLDKIPGGYESDFN